MRKHDIENLNLKATSENMNKTKKVPCQRKRQFFSVSSGNELA